MHTLARAQGRLTLVYFRSWALVECTDFEDHILKSKPVLEATAEMYCVVLEFAPDAELAQKWGLTAPPAVAILDPRGNVLARVQGRISRAALLGAITEAKQSYRGPADSSPADP